MLPIERPGKIICVGLNYRDHAEEQGADLPQAPLLFAKWPNALIGPGEAIVIPPLVQQADYEAELGVVMGATVRNVSSITLANFEDATGGAGTTVFYRLSNQ